MLRAALAHIYLHDGNDAALWQLGAEIDGVRQPGIAQQTIAALREIGVLDELSECEGRVWRYPGAKQLAATTRVIEIRAVWWHYHRCCCRHRGLPVPARMGAVSKSDADAAKARVAELARTQWRDLTLALRENDGYLLAHTPRGNCFGVVVGQVESAQITLRTAWSKGGNLYAVIDD